MNELEALLLLTSIPNLGSIKIRLLIQQFGSAAAALEENVANWLELPGFGPKIIQAREEIKQTGCSQTYLEMAEKLGIQIIPYTSMEYPKRLLETPDHPVLLYVKGTLKKEDQRCLAVIGTRQASIYGLEMAHKISRELAQAGFTVVSGLARGVDTAAHKGALEGGRTWAVLGSGLAHLYPKENEKLADAIVQKGALISEFPIMTAPDRQHFPQRNRIVSGLTLGTILIEAPNQSGAMITVNRALSQGRKIFALPGRADQENFQGNHSLIKQGQACLIENARDVLAEFEGLFSFTSNAQQTSKPAHLSILLEPEEQHLLGLLPIEELSIEDIITKTNLPISKLNVLLMSLVLKKVIKEYPGKIYKKI